MKNIINLLTAFILVNAINFSASYCMENTNESSITKIREEYISSSCDLLYRFDRKIGEIHPLDDITIVRSKLENIEKNVIQCVIKFGLYLFNDNNVENLRSILSSPEKKNELRDVYIILDDLFSMYRKKDYQYSKTSAKGRKCLVNMLKHNEQLRNKISHIVTNTKYSNGINKEHFDCVVDSIKRIILISSVGLDISFMEIFEQYQWLKKGNEHTEKIQKQIDEFINGLFGADGTNLLTVLSCDVEQELFFISQMLEEPEVKERIINKLRDNAQLLDIFMDVVQQYNSDNKYKKQIIDKIQQCLNNLYQENYY